MSVCKADTYPRYGSIAVATVDIDHTRILAREALFFSLVGVEVAEEQGGIVVGPLVLNGFMSNGVGPLSDKASVNRVSV